MYIDAFLEREKNKILVVERDKNGKRQYQEYPTKYVVYWPSPKGKYPNIFGQQCEKFQTNKVKEFHKELGILSKYQLFESDINPIFRCLYENYKDTPAPTLNIAFFDIEVNFDPLKGYSTSEEAFNSINAVSVYLSWLERNFTMVIKPEKMSHEDAIKIVEKFPDTVLCNSERELLDLFLSLIEDADIVSGWNSEGFDIPYIHNRILKQFDRNETRRLCLWNKFPNKREYNSFGKKAITYDLIGRVHLDYLQLFRKHTQQQLHSYNLDFVAEHEINEKKTPYEGGLDMLYNNDFEKFIEYNRQDTMLIVKIDKKNKYIELANKLAHDNGVLLATTMGAVSMIDQAIVNEAHNLGFVVPNRKKEQEEQIDELSLTDEEEIEKEAFGIAGAYVADPKEGLHSHIGAVDLTSLYPSTIRALNMSSETIVGHIRPESTEKLIQKRVNVEKKKYSEAWNNMFSTLEYEQVMNKELTPITIDFEDGSSSIVSASELYDLVFKTNKKLILTANGTIFTYSKPGIIPSLLTRWFVERKQLQAEQKKYANLYENEVDKDKKAEYKKLSEFYDQRQLIRKINLNSLYGALGNKGSRFFDQRIAQSTTLSGRLIAKHMGSKINEIMTGNYNHLGIGIIYQDTDSAYFSAYPVMKDKEEFQDFEWSKENVISLYDSIGDITNQSFPDFMKSAFNCPEQNGSMIKANRELCASKGIFITKKRYAVLIYDKEGKRKDVDNKPGVIKAMGLDLKRSDTPKVVQNFLSEILHDLLTDLSENQIQEKITDFRKQFRSWSGWLQGSPKRANNITHYLNLMNSESGEKGKKKITVPGHVLASINWNKLKKIHNDTYSMPIQDGFKVVVCKLKNNPSGMTSVAYPVDELQLPEWFRNLPFDSEAMEEALIDKKIENLLGVLKWDLNSNKKSTNFDDLFKF